MKQNTLFILTLLLLGLNSCSKNEAEIKLSDLGDDYLVFGHFYGECLGENCVETFALTSNKLYEDTEDNYTPSDFNFVELGSDKFDLVTGLENGFPSELLTSTEDVFGCPDCGDWGGIYVEYVKNGERNSWRIDVKLDDIPSYLQDFVKDIQEKIALINQ